MLSLALNLHTRRRRRPRQNAIKTDHRVGQFPPETQIRQLKVAH